MAKEVLSYAQDTIAIRIRNVIVERIAATCDIVQGDTVAINDSARLFVARGLLLPSLGADGAHSAAFSIGFEVASVKFMSRATRAYGVVSVRGRGFLSPTVPTVALSTNSPCSAIRWAVSISPTWPSTTVRTARLAASEAFSAMLVSGG